MLTWTWEKGRPGIGIWGTLDFTWTLILLRWHCKQDLDLELISLAILGQTKREEINLLEPRIPGWVVGCSRSKSFRLREKGTRGLGTPVETLHKTSVVPQGMEIILREPEFKVVYTILKSKGFKNHQIKKIVVFRIVQYMSEPSLESNRMPDESVYPGPLQRTYMSLCT